MKARILVWLVALFCCHNALFRTERVRESFCPLVRASSDSTTEGEEKALKKVIMKDADGKISISH